MVGTLLSVGGSSKLKFSENTYCLGEWGHRTNTQHLDWFICSNGLFIQF